MGIIIILGVCLLFFVTIDIYVYQAVKMAAKAQLGYKYLYWGVNIFLYLSLIYIFIQFGFGERRGFQLLGKFLGIFVLFFLPKLVVSAILLGEDGFRILSGIYNKYSGHGVADSSFLPSRRKFVSQLSLLLAAIPFGAILHGITRGKYDFEVINLSLYFPDLPDAFNGFKIAQISDMHTGSFDDKEKVKYGIDLLLKQEADLIAFTGDLVNSYADEVQPYMEILNKIKATYGVFSILGNHDYSHYIQGTKQEKAANFQRIKDLHGELGFHLLLNENHKIEKNGEIIHVVGVENWSTSRYFPREGDLDKAVSGIRPEDFKILLSHDPTHWDAKVVDHDHKFHLTLAGHTHGGQFGIDVPGIKWSPIQSRYKRWAGLYTENEQMLYVNKGFGYLAFPGRVGMWPEITVFTLRKGLA